jgi:hypothetical protein
MVGQSIITTGQQNGRLVMIIERLWLSDDVARLHVKIDNLNNPLVGFCFIRSIDVYSKP